MHLGRYHAINHLNKKNVLTIGISVSGRVTRTIQALNHCFKSGHKTIALTSSNNSPITNYNNLIQLLDIGEMSRTPALISFILNTLLLNLNSLHIGLASNHLNVSDYLCLIKELKCLPSIF